MKDKKPNEKGTLHVWGKENYKLTLNHKQLRIIECALDLYSRIGAAQFEIIGEVVMNFFYKRLDDKKFNQWTLREEFLEPMKEKLGFTKNGSLSIYSKEVSDDAKISWDMEKVIQKKISEVECHGEFSVWNNGSMNVGSEPDIIVEESGDE